MSIAQLTKHCSKCQEHLSVSEFHKNRTRKSGLQSWCKRCWKRYNRSAVRKKYFSSELGLAAGRRGNKKYRQRHPDREKARTAISNAIQSGKLPQARTLKCLHCGKRAKEYHHHLGYSPQHWLDVVALCKRCHGVLS